MYKIEKGLPLPRDGRGHKAVHPISDMEIGDSYFIPCVRKRAQSLRTAALGSARYLRTKSPDTHGHFTVTTALEENGVRVWRVA